MKAIGLILVFLWGCLLGPVAEVSAQSAPASRESREAKTFFDRGLEYFNQNRYEDAIAEFSRAIELNPKNHKAYTVRGELKEKQRDLEGALSDFNQAIDLDPKYGPAYLERGEIKTARADYQGAMADYLKALELDPKNSEVSGHIQELKGLMEKANRAKKEKPKKVTVVNRPKKNRSLTLEAVVPEDRSAVFGPK